MPVCVECRRNNNQCLLEFNKPCLGSITTGGCFAICVNAGLECWGCRGQTKDANLDAFMKMLEGKGFSARLHHRTNAHFRRPEDSCARNYSGVSLMTTTNLTLDEITKIEGHAVLELKITDGKIEDCHLRDVEGSRYFEGLRRRPPLRRGVLAHLSRI